LYAFFYGFLHFLTWAWLDKVMSAPDFGGALTDMVSDIFKRPFITVGMIAFVVMIPLAITSTNGWVKRLGWARWQKLHRTVYLAPAAGCVHYWWLVKSDISLPLLYAVILSVLMAFRVYQWTRGAKPVPARKPVPISR
jgi:sulfoxide reductase heme-binding subunit YedZ